MFIAILKQNYYYYLNSFCNPLLFFKYLISIYFKQTTINKNRFFKNYLIFINIFKI